MIRGCSVGGTLQHDALNTSRQVMLQALHSLNRAFIPKNTSLALRHCSSHSLLCLRLRGDDREQWRRTLTRDGEWCHRSAPQISPRQDDRVKLRTVPRRWYFTDRCFQVGNSALCFQPCLCPKELFRGFWWPCKIWNTCSSLGGWWLHNEQWEQNQTEHR